MSNYRRSHVHTWRRVSEPFILGGTFSIGWKCKDCNVFISNYELTPDGLAGTTLEEDRIIDVAAPETENAELRAKLEAMEAAIPQAIAYLKAWWGYEWDGSPNQAQQISADLQNALTIIRQEKEDE